MASPKPMSIFRRGHTLNLLNSFSFSSPKPLDGHLRSYFLKHKAVGAHDRREIADTVYDMIRHKLYLETVTGKTTWEDMLKVFLQADFHSIRKTSNYPVHIRHSFPTSMVEILTNIYGKKTESILNSLNHRAPLTVRVNTLKSSCADLMHKWRNDDKIGVRRCSHSLFGLQIINRGSVNLFGMDDFKNGLFEVQDEGSQLCAYQVQAAPGISLLDYCAGAGGKSLAIAPRMENKGQIYLYDIRETMLVEAKKRLKRAGVHNAQVASNLNRLKKRMDVVLVDAPCSGTGTIRRNPDIKWKFTIEHLNELVEKQLSIMHSAFQYLKPTGELVYTTCSLLPQENSELIHRIKASLPLIEAAPPFQTSPLMGDMDGFYTVRLKYK